MANEREEEHLDIVEAICNAWNRNEKDRILPYLDEDCVYTIGDPKRAEIVPFYGQYGGKNSIRDFFETFDRHVVIILCFMLPKYNYHVSGDTVVVSGAIKYKIKSKTDNKEHITSWSLSWHLKELKVRAMDWKFDDELMLEQWRG